MAETAMKPPSISGGVAIITDMKNLTAFVFKTRRTLAFAYGFMFAFVAFSAFLAFNPSPTNSPFFWVSNIFTPATSVNSTSTTTPSLTTGSDSYRSQFSSVFSYFFPPTNDTNNITNANTTTTFPVLPSQTNLTSFRNDNTTLSKLPTANNQTKKTGDSASLQAEKQSKTSSVVAKEPTFTKTRTQNPQNLTDSQVLKPNQTASATLQQKTEVNQSFSPPANSGSLNKDNSGKQQKGVPVNSVASNFTASLLKKQSNAKKESKGTKTGEKKQGLESLVRNLEKCDLSDGEWVKDDSYPLYKPGSCSLIDEQFNCIINGRPDKDYQKYKWQPKSCTLPRLNPVHMLDLLRGKRLAFVGDSLNRNMWESLVCILKGAVKDQRNVFEANGRVHFRGEASYSFIFKDYNCTIEFHVSPFLVQEWEMPNKNGSKRETLRLDLVGRSSEQYKGADIIIFNTGHWWTHEKTSLGKDYYQEGNHVYSDLNVLEAFRKALTTWARWVDANVDPRKSLVFFRGYSASHFSGGQWNSGGACDSEVEPIKNATYLKEYPPKMEVLEKILHGTKIQVTYLNVTRMTDFRKDGHPSIYRKQHLSEEERKSPQHYQDCSHWCLPGVPDTWNEILYAELLINESRKQQVHKRHR